MADPLTLEPGGSNPPNATQKTNILAVLGAAAAADLTALDGRTTTLEGQVTTLQGQAAVAQTQVKDVKTVSDAAYTLLADDAGKHLRFTNAGDVTVTVDDGVHALKDVITLKNATGGFTITVVEGADVTIDAPGLTIPDKCTGQVLCWDDTASDSKFDLIGGQ